MMEYDENGCLPVRSPPSLGKGREWVPGFEEAVQSPLGDLQLLEVVVMEQQSGVPVRSETEVEECGIRVGSETEVEECGVPVRSGAEVEARQLRSPTQRNRLFAGDAELTEQLFLLVVAVADFA